MTSITASGPPITTAVNAPDEVGSAITDRAAIETPVVPASVHRGRVEYRTWLVPILLCLAAAVVWFILGHRGSSGPFRQPFVTVELIDQMARDIPAVRECTAKIPREQTPALVRADPLNLRRDRQAALVQGQAVGNCSLFGARMPMQWIYEWTAGGYRLLLDVGPVDTVKVSDQSHSGYKDLRVGGFFAAGTQFYEETYAFNGQTYQRMHDGKTTATQR